MAFSSIGIILLSSTFGLTLRILIQKSINNNKFPNNTKEIIICSNTCLYSFPEINAKELLVLDIGTTLSVLRNWKVSESETWFRVELASNKVLDDPNKIKRGWIKM